MLTQSELGGITVDVELKDIKNIHLSVYPPGGRVRISAPARMDLDTIRMYAIARLSWNKKQQQKFAQQARETPREFIERESHYVWGRRYLLQVVRLIMMYNPLRVLMPIALFLLSIGIVKLVYDLVTKNFRPAANTLLLFSAAFAVVLVAVLADLIVQVSKPQHGVEPASVYRTDSE